MTSHDRLTRPPATVETAPSRRSGLPQGVYQMIAITTRYHGPTNFRGSRIIASGPDNRRLTISLDHALNADANHANAAKAWIAKHLNLDYLGSDTLIGGSPEPGTMVWVFANDPCRFTITPAEAPAHA